MALRNPHLQRLLATLNGSAVSSNDCDPSTPALGSDKPRSDNEIFVKELAEPSSYRYDVASLTSSDSQLPGLGFLSKEEVEPKSNTSVQTYDPRKRQRTEGYRQQFSVPNVDANRSRSSTPIISKDVPDASVIVTWPAALKHVTKHIVSNEQTADRIKHLIEEQRKHERQWWAQREAIAVQQKQRENNQSKAAELLRSLGGISVPVNKPSPQEDQRELETFDKKLHKSLSQMVSAFDGQLRKMGIPFYAIKHDLVILDAEPAQNRTDNRGKLDKGELRELQKRMLQTLEDLFGEV